MDDVDVFQTVDLWEKKDIAQVVLSLFALGRTVRTLLFLLPPPPPPFPVAINFRDIFFFSFSLRKMYIRESVNYHRQLPLPSLIV